MQCQTAPMLQWNKEGGHAHRHSDSVTTMSSPSSFGCCFSLYPVTRAVSEQKKVYEFIANGAKSRKSADEVNSTTGSEPESTRSTAKSTTRTSQSFIWPRRGQPNNEVSYTCLHKPWSDSVMLQQLSLRKTNSYWAQFSSEVSRESWDFCNTHYSQLGSAFVFTCAHNHSDSQFALM